MKVKDRVQHGRYGSGVIRELDGAQAIVMFDRDAATKAPRRVWTEDLTPGSAFYEGRATPLAANDPLVA